MNSSSISRPDARDAKLSGGTELQALLARVQAATGPDRALDALICAALRVGPEPGWLDRLNPDVRAEWEAVDAKVLIWVSAPGLDRAPLWGREAAAVTGSIDAALALAERVLPESLGFNLFIRRSSTASGLWIDDDTEVRGHCRTPALAVLAALLKALSHQPPRDQQSAGDKSREAP